MSKGLKATAGKLATEIKTHWNTPAKGKYVPYKEYLSLFGGVSFNYAMMTPASYISFAASCYLIMYHYNIPYLTFMVIGLIGAPLGYVWSFMGWIVADNLGFMEKKTERKMYITYGIAAALGIAFMLSDLSVLMDKSSTIYTSLNSLSGVNARTFFKLFGVQIFVAGFSGLRGILWRKKLIPKVGRFKYQLYANVIQRALLFILIGWLPIYKIGDVAERVWLLYLLISVFGLYDCGNPLGSCGDLISPNSEERILVRTFPQKFGHFFNSLLEFIVPVVIAWFPNSFGDINVYKYVLPITFIICGVMSIVFAPKIKERIPQPPLEKKVKINFWDGVFGVMRNKYRWLDTTASLLDSLGNGALAITTVVYLYTLRADGIIFSIIVAFLSLSGSITTFFSPYFMKRFSFKKLRIFVQLVNGVCSLGYIAVIYFLGDQPIVCGILMLLLMTIIRVLTDVPNTAREDMSCRLDDYQMYLSGERLSSFTGIFSIIISPITTLVSLIIPLMLLHSGYNSNWDILFVDSARFNILVIPIAIDTAGHFLMIIPYLFWDYDDKKHEMVIKELQRRAKILGGQDFE